MREFILYDAVRLEATRSLRTSNGWEKGKRPIVRCDLGKDGKVVHVEVLTEEQLEEVANNVEGSDKFLQKLLDLKMIKQAT